MITTVRDFVAYFKGIRRRTWEAVDRVTPELLGFAPRPGEFTCGDIVRHLAGAERFYVTKVIDDRWTDDLDPGPPLDLAATRARLAEVHEAQMARLEPLPDACLAAPIQDFEGRAIRTWRFLMAMVEHEVHHRSQLDTYLTLAGVEPPQIYGYRMEEVVGRARGE